LGSKSSPPSTQTVTNEPPSYLAPYLTDAAKQAQSLYQQGGGINYYPGQTVAGFDPATIASLNLTQQRALAGSPTTTAANTLATRTLNGEFLNGNPGLDNAIDSATRGLVRNYNTSVLPGINSTFSRAGRYGSNAQATAMSNAGNDLAQNIRDISSNLSYQNYNDERTRQSQAALLAPQLADADYNDAARLGEVGAARENQAQRLIDADVARYDTTSNAARMALDEYLQRIGAAGSAGSNYRSTTTTGSGVRTSPIAGALGGGLSGAATGAMIGSVFPGIGTAFGALAGAGLGGLGGYFG
jgi:hypothetical protein